MSVQGDPRPSDDAATPGQRQVLRGRRLGVVVVTGILGVILVAVGLSLVPAPVSPMTFSPAPVGTPVPGTSVSVTSVAALLTALADDTVTEIVVADGTYRVSPASLQHSDSLWIGSRFAGRTNPVTVRAETRGGVTFDGGGATTFGGLTFVEGAHDQTWDGFNFANGEATDTGVIVFGGYGGLAAPHDITLRSIAILGSVTGHNERNDHGIYFSKAVGGPHDLLLEDITIDGSGPTPLSTALHFHHSDAANDNAWRTTIRRLTVVGTYIAIRIWDPTVNDITIDGANISGARYGAVQYEQPGKAITLANVVSLESGQFGFYSSLGDNPPGMTFLNSTFR
jgi:hypothetical protein